MDPGTLQWLVSIVAPWEQEDEGGSSQLALEAGSGGSFGDLRDLGAGIAGDSVG